MAVATMMQVTALFICACISCMFSEARVELVEGDVCKQTGNTIWTCKSIKDCPLPQENLKENGEMPEMCNFNGTDPAVCCKPQVDVSSTAGVKSKEMCKVYGESVFLTLPSTIPDNDSHVTVDLCFQRGPMILIYTTSPMEFPHMALIGYESRNGTEWLCGGTLISDRFVLSAAHCNLRRNATRVRLGDYNILSKEDDNYGAMAVEYEIIERINHPQFKRPSIYNDIALFKLATEVKFNEFIRPICLQTDHQFANTYGTTAGWGLNSVNSLNRGLDVIQQKNLTIISRTQCDNAFKTSRGDLLKDGIQDASMMCAADIYPEIDNYKVVDSGGPLMLRLKEPYCMYIQLGIFSFSANARDKPGVYTRVSHFVPWIESIVWP